MILNWKRCDTPDLYLNTTRQKAVFQKEVYLSKEDTTYEGQQLLDQLATYGKDRTWLKKQSKKVAEQYILGTWFKMEVPVIP